MTYLRPLLLGLALGAVCFVLGRTTLPPRIVERTVTKTVEVQAQATASVDSIKPFTRTNTKTRTVYLPGDRVEVVREVVRETGAERIESNKTHTVAAQVQAKSIDRSIPVSKPRYSVGVWAGANTQKGLTFALPPAYGIDAGLRVLGPLWLTASGDIPNRAATLGLRLVW